MVAHSLLYLIISTSCGKQLGIKGGSNRIMEKTAK
jgi:hypothetical protein